MAHIVTRTGIGKQIPAAPLFLDVGGPVNFDSYLTVLGDVTINGILSVQRASNIDSIELRTPLDAEPQFKIVRDGSIFWGPGGSTPVDSSLYREATLLLRTNSSFTVDIDLLVTGDSTVVGNSSVLGHTQLGDNPLLDDTAFFSRVITDFVPRSDNTVDLGAPGLGWKDLYISRNAVFGTSSADYVLFNSYISSDFIPTLDASNKLGALGNRWSSLFLSTSLQNDGSTVLGTTSADTVTFNATIATSLFPDLSNTHDIGSLIRKWRSLYLGSNLSVDGDSVFGIDATDKVTFNAQIVNSLVPDLDNSYNLGAPALRWGTLYLGGGMDVDGPVLLNDDVTLGDSSSDTIVFNGLIASDFIPEIDNVFDLGTTALRWKTIHVGPGSVVVHNDNTDTNKVVLGFELSRAVLNSDAATELQLNVGSNRGIIVYTDGKVGVNTNVAATYDLEVFGNFGASDTVYGLKATGTSVYSESNVVVKGSIEAESVSKILNVGTTSDTEFINIGTGPGLQTINIGTGPGPTVINIGGAGDIINFLGIANYSQTINSSVLDKSFVLNSGGANGTTAESGIFVEQADIALLAVDDALWQSGNIVRYYMTDTGEIAAGNTVTITGFSNFTNNGSFSVVAVINDTYVDLNNPARSDATDDETGATAFATNPVLVAGIHLSTDSFSWEMYSALFPNNKFVFKNSGADTTLDSTSTALVLDPAGSVLRPAANAQDLGTPAARWDLFAESSNTNSALVNTLLQVDGDTVLGNNSLDTVTINAITSFIGTIATNLIPETGTLDIGSSGSRWRDLWLSGSADIDGSVDVAVDLAVDGDTILNGSITLGDTSLDSIVFNALVNSSIIPQTTSAFNLGSSSLTWSNLFADLVTVPGIAAGSVVYANSTNELEGDPSNFKWDLGNYYLGIGLSTPLARLHLADSLGGVGAILSNLNASAGLGFFGDVVSRVQYSGTSLAFSYSNDVDLGTSAAGVNNLSLFADGTSIFGGGIGLSSLATVATNTYAVSALDTVVRVDSSSGSITSNCTVTLPSAASLRMLVIKDVGNNCSALNKNIILTPASGEYIEFGAVDQAYTMDIDGMSLTLHSNGVDRWYII